MKMTAKTTIYFQDEMWRKGETKEVNAHYAHELKQAGLVEDAKNGENEGAKAPEFQPNFFEQTAKPKRKALKNKMELPELKTK